MCGITGFIHVGCSREISMSRLEKMLIPIYHRGPDDGGMWMDDQYGVAIGHRRLSILDLSPLGHQPMASACGRFVIVFNGEIYNHLDLRKKLEKLNQLPIGGWRSHSDTETLLACFAVWGIEQTLQATVGMFALALWDKHTKSLTLTRDRIGEKPLYYGWQDKAFIFGSELKSLRAHPAFSGEMDWHVASTFLRLNYIPAPYSIYRGIFKLVPGTYLLLTQANIQQRTLPLCIPYWSLNDSVKKGMDNPFTGSFSDAVDELEILVYQAVQQQTVADVPVGAFLSGGIDSSTIVAMMQNVSTSKVTTFCIGMPDVKMDESQNAAAVARHLGTNHIEHIIEPQEALDLIPRLHEIWDEPFADNSQIPTFLVCHLARQLVTVALSGDGADEIFLGYQQYAFCKKIWKTRQLGKLPWDTTFALLSPLADFNLVGNGLRRAKTVVEAWRQPNTQALHSYLMDNYQQGDVPLTEQDGIKMLNFSILPDASTTAGLWDFGTYLPDDILVKLDRAAMANSLETRAPFLDHRIIEFANRLPLEYKLGNRKGKKVLRELLYRHVPKQMVDRPKMGFSIPLAAWLRNELRPWAEDLLEQIPQDSEQFNKPMINQLWKEHLSGKDRSSGQLWAVLSLLGFIKR